MNNITKQFVLTIYEDGTLRITERGLPKRGYHGYFTGKPRVLGKVTCPNYGAHLTVMKEVA